MGPANKGIFFNLAKSISSRLRYNNKISNNSSFPGSRFIPRRLQHVYANRDEKLLLRRRRLDGNTNTNEGKNVSYFSILGTDNNGSHFSLEKNYCLANHRFDMQSMRSRIVGSCNGIICLNDDYQLGNIVLWNPLTDELKYLPPTSIDLPAKAPYILFGHSVFGFDPRSDDYKVLRFVENGMLSNYRTENHFEVYSLKNDSWKQIINPVKFRYPCRDPLEISSFTLNGSCYWETDNRILCFDFADEVFSYLPLPPIQEKSQIEEDIERCLVGIDGSTLGLIVRPHRSERNFCLWVWESKEWCWSKVDSFKVRDGVRVLLGLFGGDKCFFGGWLNELMLFDLTTRELKTLDIEDHFPWATSLVPFVESTVSIKGHSNERINDLWSNRD
ncbi:hypothetical protein CASFOL_010862 [Castilleja foliolosa]|uniref:F-box associated beta-propeller type 1 domain-containing protein n=1 Tax=Castilleja foliolosa TaxID=1961234 RepID=A0ABD3DVR2_9LAMI